MTASEVKDQNESNKMGNNKCRAKSCTVRNNGKLFHGHCGKCGFAERFSCAKITIEQKEEIFKETFFCTDCLTKDPIIYKSSLAVEDNLSKRTRGRRVNYSHFPRRIISTYSSHESYKKGWCKSKSHSDKDLRDHTYQHLKCENNWKWKGTETAYIGSPQRKM